MGYNVKKDFLTVLVEDVVAVMDRHVSVYLKSGVKFSGKVTRIDQYCTWMNAGAMRLRIDTREIAAVAIEQGVKVEGEEK